MLLEEVLFCAVFLILPVIGMIGTVIARVLREGFKTIEEASNKQHRTYRKRVKGLPVPAFVNEKVMEYQLIESQVHIPLKLNQLKEGTHQRAGP